MRRPMSERIVTGGDDGKVVALNGKGEVTVLATDPNGAGSTMSPCTPTARWRGRPARPRFSAHARARRNPSTRHQPSAACAAPKGLRVAVAHYNGVTLWFPNMAAKPEYLEWAGSHLGVIFSPDNKFLVTAMHEPALHGWRLADNRHMRMSGYPGRVRSMPWTVAARVFHLGRRHRDHLAVQQQGRPDGQGAGDAGAVAGARLHDRLPPEARHYGRGL